MREIKFRAWDKERNEMYDVDALHFCRQLIEVDSETDHQTTSIEPYELMQYTGLKDKNGKEIYEGDIVQGGILRMTGGVEMYNSRTTVHFKGGMFKCGQSSLNSFNDRTEVVGNIYENPELLGGNQ